MVASHCLSTDGASASPRSCLPLSPSVSPHVSLCWTLASHGLRTGVPVLDGVSVFPRFVSPCLHLFRYMYAGCWMVCPPSRGLVSPSLRLCSIVSHMCACVRCCVRLPEVLSPIVSHCLPTYACLCWMVCPLVSPCFPLFPPYCGTRELALEGVLLSRGLVSPLSPHIYIYTPPLIPHRVPMPPIAFIVPPLLSLSPHMRACGYWARLFEASLCWMVRPHSRALVSPGLQACLPCLPTCVPVADDAPAFPRSCPALSPCVGCCLRVPPVLPPFVSLLISLSWMVCPRFWSLVSLLIFLRWMVRLPSWGLVLPCPPLVSHCLPACVPHMCACVVWPPSRGLASSCLFFSPHVCLCWMVRPPSRGLASACLP